MRKSKFLIFAFLIVMATSFSLMAQEQGEINILFIGNSFTVRPDLNELEKKVVEDMSPHFGYNGETLVKTPNVDKMANLNWW